MLVHVSESGGKPVMVSLPRDSYVPIPGHGSNKINAAYSIGGPKLLTETVENVTGIHIDGYVEIGLGGFASVVDSVGGVDLCVPRDMKDKKAGIDLKKGCQTLDGGNALGYVRSRYEDPLGDIGRAARQRQFLGALMKKAATPSTVLIPWRYKSFADASAAGLAVGTETGIMDAVAVLAGDALGQQRRGPLALGADLRPRLPHQRGRPRGQVGHRAGQGALHGAQGRRAADRAAARHHGRGRDEQLMAASDGLSDDALPRPRVLVRMVASDPGRPRAHVVRRRAGAHRG